MKKTQNPARHVTTTDAERQRLRDAVDQSSRPTERDAEIERLHDAIDVDNRIHHYLHGDDS